MRRDLQTVPATEARQQPTPEVAAKPRRLFERTAEPFMMEQQQSQRPTPAYSRDAARLRTVMASGRQTSTQRPEPPDTEDETTAANAVANKPTANSPADAVRPHQPIAPDDGDRRETRLRVVMAPSTASQAAPREATLPRTPSAQGTVQAAEHISMTSVQEPPPVAAEPTVPASHAASASGGAQVRQPQGDRRSGDDYKRFDPTVTDSAIAVNPVIQPDVSYTPRHFPKRSIWRTIPLALTVGIGIMIAIGLYIGGSDLLAGIFANENEGITPPNPAAITDRPRPATEQPLAEIPPPTAASLAGSTVESPTTAGDAVAPANSPAAETPAPSVEAPARPEPTTQPVAEKPARPAQAVATQSSSTATAPPSEKKKETSAKTETRPVENKPRVEREPQELHVKALGSDKTTEVSEAKGTIYNVQVRATTDQAEADLVAKRLKRKGFGNVTILQTEKKGAPFYRIRFGSFTSKKEATAAAGASGYSGTWVVQQR